MFRLWSHVGLNRDWAHFTGLLFPSLSLLAELHKDKALIWKSIPHTRLSQQHTGFHYLEQVASARRSATLRIQVGGFWGPQASPCLLPESQSVSVSLLLRRLSDHATSLSPPCLTPFPLISYMFNRTMPGLFGYTVSPDCFNISKSDSFSPTERPQLIHHTTTAGSAWNWDLREIIQII